MDKQDEHIILASNVKSFSEANENSNFKTLLARKRNFPSNEDWRVAVSEISYKQSWYNVKEPVHLKYIFADGKIVGHGLSVEDEEDMVVEPGYYENVESLVNVINAQCSKLQKVVKRAPKLYYHWNTQKIVISPGVIKKYVDSNNSPESRFIPVLGRQIENILGFIDERGYTIDERILENQKDQFYNNGVNDTMTKIFDSEKIYGSYPVDINQRFNNLYIYSNIVQMSDVGDAYVPILTTIPNKRSKEGWGGSVNHEPKNLIYRPLQLGSFDTIEIEIKDDSGRYIQFLLGNVIVKLHFVRYG